MHMMAFAQTPEDHVRMAIDKFFDGMRAGDSTMVRSVLHPEARMGRATDQGYITGTLDGFVQAVGTPHDEIWDERIWHVEIQIDDRLASAWMEFAFYLGKELSHCGVNSILLYLENEEWKVTHISDTNRGKECDIPSEIQK